MIGAAQVTYSEVDIYRARQKNIHLAPKRRIRLVDLFCGAGGLSLGFSKSSGHHFDPVWANDFDKASADTYSTNFGTHCELGDINEILANDKLQIPPADIVIGGPPCQGFSLLNKNRHSDPRKQLWRPYLEVVRRVGATMFVMENVPQLQGSPEYAEIVEEAKKQGFQVYSEVLCAADYGVPQKRFRVFLIGCKFAEPSTTFPPKKTHYNPNNGHTGELFRELAERVASPEPWRTVRDVIGELPPPTGSEIRESLAPMDLHFGRNPTPLSLLRYKAIPREGMNRFDLFERAPKLTPPCWVNKKSGSTDLFGRLWWDRPALTIRTEFFKPEKGRYLHPSQHRPITHREAARIQTFPDDFVFKGSKIEIAKQIGNAVPPMLASRVADSVYALWLNNR